MLAELHSRNLIFDTKSCRPSRGSVALLLLAQQGFTVEVRDKFLAGRGVC